MKQFQPNPRCGNCQSFRHSKGHHDPKTSTFTVTEPAACGKDCDPKTCGDEFKPRNKKGKRMKNRMKKWERGFSYNQEAR